MSLPIVFRRAARAEFDEAADWFEQRQATLGMMFMAAVQRILDVIASHPKFTRRSIRMCMRLWCSDIRFASITARKQDEWWSSRSFTFRAAHRSGKTEPNKPLKGQLHNSCLMN